MILKASQRGGGQNLAAHLMRVDENEHVELHEVRGFVSDTLHGAFKEAHAVARGTRCRQYLFSVSLNPPPSEDVGLEIFESAIARIEERLGLIDQPRAIVFHEKEGRRHAHAVWSRIDAETMTAKQMSFFKTKLRDLSRELYLENDWRMPRGLADPAQRDPRNFTLEEWQRSKRTGVDPRALRTAVQDAWAMSDNRQTFEAALNERGYWLSRGDRRGHVILDHQGEVHSLARLIDKKVKDVRARLGDPAALKSVEVARQDIAATMTPLMKRHINHARDMFARRKADLDAKRLAARDADRAMRVKLVSEQAARREKEAKARAERLPKGLRGLWSRITGKYKKLVAENELDAARCQQRDRKERQAMVTQQLEKRRILMAVIKQERARHADLLSSLRKDVARFRALERSPEPQRSPTQSRQPTRER